MCNPDWLPDPIMYSDYGGDFQRFIDDIHSEFCNDFVRSGIQFRNKNINIKMENINGKEETFWKVISEKFNTPQECIDFRRCELIKWIGAIILNADSSPDIVIYKVKRRKKSHSEMRTVLWLEKVDFKVILREHHTHFFLVSAHKSEWEHTRENQENERDSYFRSIKSA